MDVSLRAALFARTVTPATPVPSTFRHSARTPVRPRFLAWPGRPPAGRETAHRQKFPLRWRAFTAKQISAAGRCSTVFRPLRGSDPPPAVPL